MIDFIRKGDARLVPSPQKKAPQKIIPICSCCKKIHVDRESWQQLEIHHIENSSTALSHDLCPQCYEEQRTEFMKFKSRQIFHQAITL